MNDRDWAFAQLRQHVADVEAADLPDGAFAEAQGLLAKMHAAARNADTVEVQRLSALVRGKIASHG